jgi:hypothetical protein
MSNYKRAQKDTSQLYKQLIEKQKEFIRKNSSGRPCNDKKKIIVSPAFLTFAKEYEKNSYELDERIAKYSRKDSQDITPSKPTSLSLRESISPTACIDKFCMLSPRIKKSSRKDTMLIALHDSDTHPKLAQSPSILQEIKRELSVEKLERSMKKTQKLSPIVSSPRRFRYINSRFAKQSDNSWMYKHRNLEDLLRNDCEKRVREVIDEALLEFEIDPASYA